MPNHTEIIMNTHEWRAFHHSARASMGRPEVVLRSVNQMKSFQYLLARVSPLILVCGLAAAQTAAPVQSSSASARVTPQMMPVSELHRGMRGVAYTVFEGTKPEAMEVEILGVLPNL